jgi:glycine reductase
MKLTLAIHPISEVRLGSETGLAGEVLTIDAAALQRELLADPRFESVEVDLVRPGEACRIGGVFDVVEPRAKEPADGVDFPGVLGPVRLAGRGTTHVLRGAAVTILDEAGGGGAAGPGAQTAGRMIEMTGPAAEYCPYAKLHHIVLIPHARPGLESHAFDNGVHTMKVKAAAYLARCAIGQAPAST